jgi:hypothetical protein
MTALPAGWINLPHVPETYLPEYSHDPTPGTLSALTGPNQNHGYQPITGNNPKGDYAALPAMAITAEVGATLAGPQPTSKLSPKTPGFLVVSGETATAVSSTRAPSTAIAADLKCA